MNPNPVPSRFAVPLEPRPSLRSYLSLPLQLAHVATPLLSALGFARLRADLPARIPIHFDARGRVNRYGSPDELWMLLGVMLFVLVLHWAVAWAITRERRVLPISDTERYASAQRVRRTTLVRMLETATLATNLMLGALWLTIALGSRPDSGLSVVPAVVWVTAIGGVSILVASLWFLPRLVRADRELQATGGAALGTRSAGWRWGGLVYYAPDDPALFVPKLRGIGSTLNFARPAAWLVLGLILAVPVLAVSIAQH